MIKIYSLVKQEKSLHQNKKIFDAMIYLKF